MKENKMHLSNKQYDLLKLIVQVLLPGLGTLYFAVAQIWGLPKAEEVVGTVAAVSVFLGLLLNREKAKYDNSDEKYDADLNITEDPEDGQKYMSLGLNVPPEVIEGKDEVLLKVHKPQS